MKLLVLAIFSLFTFAARAQNDIKPSDSFTITGEVSHEITFTLADLEKFESKKIDNVIITNHMEEAKETDTNLRGIPIKEILAKTEFRETNPKLFSQFYLVFEATDGYRVVYSWNEIFNTTTGDNTYIITQKNDQKLAAMSDRILLLTTSDLITGRRNMKALSKIIIRRA